MTSENKPKATKAHLKRVRLLKEEIIRMLNSETLPKRKLRDEPLLPGESRVGLYPMVMAPLSEEQKETLQCRLREIEEEEKRVVRELELGNTSIPKTSSGQRQSTKTRGKRR